MENKNLKVAKTNKEKPILLPKYAMFDSKKFRFTKESETEGLLSMIGKVPILGPI